MCGTAPATGGAAGALDATAAHQLAADLELQYDAHGPRDAETVRRLEFPQPVDRATWQSGGLLDAWVLNRRDATWVGRVRRTDGTIDWIPSAELRPHQAPPG